MKVVVEFGLVEELRVLGVDWLKFYGNLEVCFGVEALVYLTESPLVYLTDYLYVLSHLL